MLAIFITLLSILYASFLFFWNQFYLISSYCISLCIVQCIIFSLQLFPTLSSVHWVIIVWGTAYLFATPTSAICGRVACYNVDSVISRCNISVSLFRTISLQTKSENVLCSVVCFVLFLVLNVVYSRFVVHILVCAFLLFVKCWMCCLVIM
jgi:hypothetical protein